MYRVITERYRGRKDKKPGTVRISRARELSSDEQQIAKDLVEIMRDADDRFSGMEEFGEAHGFWSPEHQCPVQEGEKRSEECKELELDSCREWIESALKQLSKGQRQDFHLGRPGTETSFYIEVTALD